MQCSLYVIELLFGFERILDRLFMYSIQMFQVCHCSQACFYYDFVLFPEKQQPFQVSVYMYSTTSQDIEFIA